MNVVRSCQYTSTPLLIIACNSSVVNVAYSALYKGKYTIANIEQLEKFRTEVNNGTFSGANNDNTASQIVQFAKMGSIYTNKVFGIEQPKLYLLSNGTEEEKGSPEIKEAHQILKKTNFPGFMGNVEAREALDGNADVLITGGFPGNVFLKSCEGVFSIMNNMMKKMFKKNIFSKLGYLLCKSGVKEIKETFDYKSIGGSMLLGVNGVVVKAHGNSEAYGFSCAMNVAYKMAKVNIVSLMKEGLKENE